MQTEILKQSRTLLISPDGDIDHHSAAKIRAEADRAIASTGIINIAFDLSGVSFMDSSGIGMIMGRYRKIRILGGRIYIIAARPEVMRILGISGLGDMITMCNTAEEIGVIK